MNVAWILLACLAHGQSVVHDVIYAKQEGAAFTMDVFKPEKPNGQAVICLISGGWFSRHEGIDPFLAKAIGGNGVTVFEVVHGSQPRYVISDIVGQLQRAVRYIRYNAATFGIQPQEIGVTGMSSGGHLSLMLGALGAPGDPNAKDPVDRVSSAVNAIVDFMGPTDFLNWGEAAKEASGIPNLAMFMPAFGANARTSPERLKTLGHDLSPLYKVSPSFPPTYIVHGDQDKLVPIQQSRLLDAALESNHVNHKFQVVSGTGHDSATYLAGLPGAVKWFETYLKP